MQELIKITKTSKGHLVLSAKDLHYHLKTNMKLQSWFEICIKECGLTENIDYKMFAESGDEKCELTLNAAKTISKFTDSELSEEMFDYLIDYEFMSKNQKVEIMDQPKTEIQLFNNPQFGDVRILGTPENPLFCLADLCKALEISNMTDVKNRLPDGVVSLYPISDSLGRQQIAYFVNEDGMYDVFIDSRKPEAKVFRKWITSEVLPSLRKTGSYSMQSQIPQKFSEALLLAGRLQQEVERQQEQLQIQEPKVEFYDSIIDSNGSFEMSAVAKMFADDGLKFGKTSNGVINLFRFLRENKILKDDGTNQPYQRYINSGWFKVVPNKYDRNGKIDVTTTTRVHPKGVEGIRKLLKQKTC
jgi:anti-repressor protein